MLWEESFWVKSFFLFRNVDDKKKILAGDWPQSEKLIVFDEIHKYPKWKNLIKGIYDTEKDLHKIISCNTEGWIGIYKNL